MITKDDLDPLAEDAAKLMLSTKHYKNAVNLSNRMKLGLNRKLRILGQLEQLGVIGPEIPAQKKREVLVSSVEDIDKIFAPYQ